MSGSKATCSCDSSAWLLSFEHVLGASRGAMFLEYGSRFKIEGCCTVAPGLYLQNVCFVPEVFRAPVLQDKDSLDQWTSVLTQTCRARIQSVDSFLEVQELHL